MAVNARELIMSSALDVEIGPLPVQQYFTPYTDFTEQRFGRSVF